MKKSCLNIICGIMAACLLPACGAESGKQEELQAAEAVQPEIVVGADSGAGETAGEKPEQPEDKPNPGDGEGSEAADEVEELAEVQETGADFFIVAKIEAQEFEDGSSVAALVLNEEDMELYDVCYTDQTEFIVRNLSRDGMEHADAAGSALDLEAGVMVNLTGSWEESHFNASRVIIEHFAD